MRGSALLLVWLILPAGAFAQSSPVSATEFQVAYDQLRRIAPRPDRSAPVGDFLLTRDAAQFHLRSGTLTLLTSVAGRTIGAVFEGAGSLSLRPPLPMERAELLRVLKDSLVSAPFTSAVFLFTDSTAVELERRLPFGPSATAAAGAPQAVGAALDFLIEDRVGWVEPALMTPLLNGDTTGFFAGYVNRPGGDDLMFQSNPDDIEESLLLRRGRFPGQRVQIISQFQRAQDLADTAATAPELPDPLELESYRIESTIQENLAFRATARVRVKDRRGANRWARFSLYSDLRVDSVTTDAGAPLSFVRPRQSRELWIRLGDARSLNVAYHGALVEWRTAWAFVKSTAEWFPRYGSWQTAGMALIFHTPTSYRLATIGRRVESTVAGKVETSRWETEAPTGQASFNIGVLRESRITDPRIPPVTVQVNDAARRVQRSSAKLEDAEAEVGADVANSLAFFTRVFGPPLFSHYYATEIPYGHGQAFPGLIHLSRATFQSTQDDGANEVFRAHEMAHQWWGIGVAPVDYRDAWLAEGFSEFAGMWYMQLILNDNEKYFKQLETAGREIRRVHHDAPPIAMGYRIAQAEPEHYATVVYRKGAWVVHMLRNLMLDFRTMSEDRFSAMMADFYATYRGRRASTGDFQRTVEKHFGLSMDWFFNQWVRGTAVPTYTLSWQTEPQADGKLLLRFRVRQEKVPPDFIMPVPLQIEFPDGSRATIRVNVRGEKVEGELPVPGQPVRLTLNPLQSVLADVKEEAWR